MNELFAEQSEEIISWLWNYIEKKIQQKSPKSDLVDEITERERSNRKIERNNKKFNSAIDNFKDTSVLFNSHLSFERRSLKINLINLMMRKKHQGLKRLETRVLYLKEMTKEREAETMRVKLLVRISEILGIEKGHLEELGDTKINLLEKEDTNSMNSINIFILELIILKENTKKN